MPQIILEYPIWFIVFCLLLGAIYSLALYVKSTDFPEDVFGFKYGKIGLAVFRFLSIAIISFLLLSPFIKSRFTDMVDPVIVFAHDNTESMKIGFSEEDSAQYIAAAGNLHEQLSAKYAIDYFYFDNTLAKGDTLDFKGKSTDLSAVLDEIAGLYHNRNVGAVILASDGIYNEGNNPIYTDFSFPIYTIALGDTTVQKDLKIANIRNNKIAYLDDQVNVEIDVEAYQLNNGNYQLQVFKNGNTVSTQNFSINDDFVEQKSEVTITASTIGMQRYSVVVSEMDDEVTYDNNQRDFFIDVIDSRQKILLVANAPHPDIAALKKVIENNKNYELDVQYITKYNASLAEYNLVILHQIPSKDDGASNLLAQVKEENVPTFFIGGASSNFGTFNTAQNTITVTPSANNTDDAGVYFQSSFNLFNISDETMLKMKRFPPLQVPFGSYETGVGAQEMLMQKIGAVETDFPILALQDNLGNKSATFIGEGLWRWRMYDYLDNGNHDAFDEVLGKTINYLALKADKRKFRVDIAKNIFYEGEMIEIQAELYNESYELVNKPDVSLTLTNQAEEEFPLALNKANNAYSLKTNSLPVGDYSYTAVTTYNGKNYTATGAFSIEEMQLEALQTQANHNLLYQLSEKTGGELFYPNRVQDLTDKILAREDIKPTLYESFKTRSIVNLFWIFLVIMGLLSVEWFARKFAGGY
ncbi:MAG: hypothetical protein ACPG4Z_06290 [Chitinophagales bacterium]